MKRALIAASLLLATPSMAQQTDPSVRVLGQMLMEAQLREAQALVRAVTAEDKTIVETGRVLAAERKIEAEKARADAAEKKIAEAAVKP